MVHSLEVLEIVLFAVGLLERKMQGLRQFVVAVVQLLEVQTAGTLRALTEEVLETMLDSEAEEELQV